jgi:HK97 family phage portal protein
MGLLDTIKGIFKGNKIYRYNDFLAAMTSHRGQGTGGMVVSDKTAMNFTAVWAAIRILSESVAQLPLNILETDNSGNKIKSTNHQLYNLIHRKPNDIMTTYTFIQKCMMDLLTRGNSFVFINRNTNGRPIELLPLEVGKVKLVENEGVIYYELQDGGIVDHYDILHFKIMSQDGLVGISPIDVGANAIGYGLALQTYSSSFFANGAKVSGVLSTDRQLSDEAINRLRVSFNENYSNIQDSNKTMVLEEGLKFNQISLSNEASQMLQSREFSIAEISRLYNLPNHLLRDLTKSSFNNISEEGLNFVKYSLMPYLVMMESEMNCKLFRKNEEGKIHTKFNVNALLRGTPKDRSEYYRTMLNIGAMSIDEIRQLEELPTIQGGENHFMQLNMATLNNIIDGGTLKGVEKKNLNSRAVSDISLKVTKGMQEQARIGLKMRKEFNRGGTAVGVKTANMIINDQMTVERVKKMYSYLKRHEVDKQAEGFSPGEEGYPSAGAIAWKLWGGQPAVAWSTKKRNQIEKEENASN